MASRSRAQSISIASMAFESASPFTITSNIPTPTHTAVRRNSAPSPAAAFQHIITLAKKTNPQQNQGDKLKKTYKCSHCPTTFRRSEHCIRHERSHTMEKPYACSMCNCQFSRKDLVVRHERTVHADRVSSDGTSRPTKRRKSSAASASIPSPLPTVEEATDAIYSPEAAHTPVAAGPVIGELDVFRFDSAPEFKRDPSVPLTPPASLTADTPRMDKMEYQNSPANSCEIEFTDNDLNSVLSFLPSFPETTAAQPIYDAGNSLFPGSPLDPLDFDLCCDLTPNGSEAPEFTTLTESMDMGSPIMRRGTDLGYISEFSITQDGILSDLSNAGIPSDLLSAFQVPSDQKLAMYIESYFSTFHRHFPILHRETFTSRSQPACLALAVTIFGALYCLERKRAQYLYEWTKRLLALEEGKWKHRSVVDRAWIMTTRLLLGFYGCWSGESSPTQESVGEAGLLSAYFRATQKLVRDTESRLPTLNYDSWLQNESLKRLCYGIFIHQSYISALFNIPPTIAPTSIILPLPTSSHIFDSPNPIPPNSPAPSFSALLPTSTKPATATPPENDDLTSHLLSHAALCTQFFTLHSTTSTTRHNVPQPPPPAPAPSLTSLPPSSLTFSTRALHLLYLLRHHTPGQLPTLDCLSGTPCPYDLSLFLSTPPSRGTSATAAAEVTLELLAAIQKEGLEMAKRTAGVRWGMAWGLVAWMGGVIGARWRAGLRKEGGWEAGWEEGERKVMVGVEDAGGEVVLAGVLAEGKVWGCWEGCGRGLGRVVEGLEGMVVGRG